MYVKRWTEMAEEKGRGRGRPVRCRTYSSPEPAHLNPKLSSLLFGINYSLDASDLMSRVARAAFRVLQASLAVAEAPGHAVVSLS